MNRIQKKTFTAFLSLALILSFTSSAFAESGGGIIDEVNTITAFGNEQVGGGTWEYGTKTTGVFKKTKTVWSGYWHPMVSHGASAQLGSNTPNRSCVRRDLQAYAKQSSTNTDLRAYTYWNNSCDPY